MGRGKISSRDTEETRIPLDQVSAGPMNATAPSAATRPYRCFPPKTKSKKLHWCCHSGRDHDHAPDATPCRSRCKLRVRSRAADALAKSPDSRFAGWVCRNRQTPVDTHRLSL